jgi:hypothetical protein
MIAVLCAAITLTACDDYTSTARPGQIAFADATAPSTAIASRIHPAKLPILSTATVCPLGLAFPFATAFDLVIVPAGNDLVMDRVTFRLIDGSNVGGNALTFPQPRLQALFGSTAISTMRTFPFRPEFGCGAGQPLAIIAVVDLITSTGATRTLTLNASF